ncbi:MAG TPA: hypothetical protein VGG30_09200 [Pirellulales bacterium]
MTAIPTRPSPLHSRRQRRPVLRRPLPASLLLDNLLQGSPSPDSQR